MDQDVLHRVVLPPERRIADSSSDGSTLNAAICAEARLQVASPRGKKGRDTFNTWSAVSDGQTNRPSPTWAARRRISTPARASPGCQPKTRVARAGPDHPEQRLDLVVLPAPFLPTNP